MTTAREKNIELMDQIQRRGVYMSEADARTLRRAQLTLRRWAEEECGLDNGYSQYNIERDEVTGKPFRIFHPYAVRHYWGDGTERKNYSFGIPDRQAGALRRVAEICERYGLHYYHHGDPRGCSLYIDTQPIPDNNYTSAIACII